MLFYLSRNARPDIEYAVHQCTRFQNTPTKSHVNIIKRIVRYLLCTKNKGVQFISTGDSLHSECFEDTWFAGNYNQEVYKGPYYVKFRI